MMAMSLAGAVILTGATGWAGELVAAHLRQRAEELRELANRLGVLSTQIEYGATPLPEALHCVGRGAKGAVAELLRTTAQVLTNSEGIAAGEAWQQGLAEARRHAAWNANDAAVLAELIPVLGRSHRDDQLRHLRGVAERLLAAHEAALREARERGRMWRSLGWLMGLAVSLVLW